MSFIANPKQQEAPSEEALTVRLKRFIEISDLSLYQIASLIGTNATILSMWLAGRTRPHMIELEELEKYINSTAPLDSSDPKIYSNSMECDIVGNETNKTFEGRANLV